MNKVIQDITLCKRAGKLVIGFDVVKESLIQKTAAILIMANDISPKTQKEVRFLSEKYQTELIEINQTMDELWYVLGKRAGVFSVTDKALAEKIKNDTFNS